jgi:hypothetical protein
MDYELDRGIALEASGPGQYAATLDPGWVVGGGLNGGYLLAVIGNAIRAELADRGQPDPVSVSAYYLTPTTPGPALVRVRRLREGGRRSTVAASLVQEQDGAEVERITVPTTDRSTRSRCCSSSTRCRPSPSTWVFPAGRRRSS